MTPTLRIFVVDDDRGVCAVLWRSLTARGLQVECYDTFTEARIQVAANPPDILFADIRLGQYNGLQLATIGRSVKPQMQIVMMSGWYDDVLAEYAASLGAAYVQKPFAPGALDAILPAVPAAAVPSGAGLTVQK